MIAVWIFWEVLYGQEDNIYEELIEQTPEDSEGPSFPDSWYDLWIQSHKIPLNLNKVNLSDLREIPWLTPIQIESLRSHLKNNGPLITLYELQAVPGWDLGTIRLIEPLVYVEEKGSTFDPRNWREKFRQEKDKYFLLRYKRQLELSQGYRGTISGRAFQGPPYYLMGRLRYKKKGEFSLGILFEKDAGENYRWDPNALYFGADFWSFHIMIENKAILERLILGDFQVQWDQGLVLNRGFNLGKQVVTASRRVHQGILPYSSISENNFFRGAGMDITLGKTKVNTFYSHRSLDAAIIPNEVSTNTPEHVPSIISSGLHRTARELSRRQQLREQVMGFHLSRSLPPNLWVALSTAYQFFDRPLLPQPRRYNAFHFSGNKNLNLSGSIEYSWRNLQTFGQIAVSRSGGRASLAGLITSLSPTVSLSLHYRNYQRNYHGIRAGAFGVQTGNINERGIYWGAQITPNRHWILGAFFDHYRFPWLTSQTDRPSYGTEGMVRLQFIPEKKTSVDFQWRTRVRLRNDTAQPGKLTNDVLEQTKHTIWLKAKWSGSDKIHLKTRIQWSQLSPSRSESQGFLISNELSYHLNSLKLVFSTALFNTDNFENRQFSYERDLLYSFSIPFFDGIGSRWYFLAQVKILRQVQCWVRIAQTQYRNLSQIGSGMDTVIGSKKTDLRLQLLYKL